MVERRSVLEFYGGIDTAVAGYLDPAEFVAFFRELDARSKSIDGGERARLNRLLTALNFTMLELLRTPRDVPYDAVMVGECLDNLAGHAAFPEMKGYREAGGTLDGYMDSAYEPLVPRTGVLSKWGLMKYEDGMLLRYPQSRDVMNIRDFVDNPLLYSVFKRSRKEGDTLGCQALGQQALLLIQQGFGVLAQLDLPVGQAGGFGDGCSMPGERRKGRELRRPVCHGHPRMSG